MRTGDNSVKRFYGILALALAVCLLSPTPAPGAEIDHLANLLSLSEQSPYIRHALGAMDGYTYLNSLDAMDAWYQEGDRLFEVDVRFSSDGYLLLSHGWTRSDYVKRLGVEFDYKAPVPTREQFTSWKLRGKYSANSFAQLVEYMREHADAYVLLDFWMLSYENTLKAYRAVMEETGGDASVLNRFIVGGHTGAMVRAVKEVYDFPLLMIYIRSDGERKGTILETMAQVAKFSGEYGVKLYSTSFENFRSSKAKALGDAGLTGFVFTTDDEDTANRALSLGATFIGTNSLR